MTIFSKRCVQTAVCPDAHLGDGWVLVIVDAQEGSELQQQLRAHGCIPMDPCHEADLWFRRLNFFWVVGYFQSPNSSELHTLAQTTFKKRDRN